MVETLNYVVLNFVFSGLPLLMLALAWLLRKRFAKTALVFFWGTLAVLWVAATPAVARAWAHWVESRYPPLQLEALPKADAIVVLSGGRRAHAPEFGVQQTLLSNTLERTRYGALLAKRTGLPVIVSGGRPNGRGTPLATMMKDALQSEFGVANVQAEPQSNTTLENARYTAKLLGPGKTILLVTEASHMPRAVLDFQAQGVTVIAAPTAFTSDGDGDAATWVPSVYALRLTNEALRETIGWLRSYVRSL
ncbi:MAG: YdcF family protein [Burkholderiaceae bacterium]